MFLRLIFVFLFTPWFSSNLLAWDSEEAVVFPFPVGSVPNQVALDDVKVTLADGEVNIRYLFSSRSNVAESSLYSVYLPIFSWSGVGAEYSDKHFPELQVFSNGKFNKVSATKVALFNGRVVTRELDKVGLDPVLVGEAGKALLDANLSNKKRYRSLIRKGVLKQTAGLLIPAWSVQVSYWWRHVYQPLTNSEMVIKYSARPGFFQASVSDIKLSSLLMAHCGNVDMFMKLASEHLSDGDELLIRLYKIPFGIDHLNVDGALFAFLPKNQVNESRLLASYVCSEGNHGEMEKNGEFKVHHADGVVSILEIKKQ